MHSETKVFRKTCLTGPHKFLPTFFVDSIPAARSTFFLTDRIEKCLVEVEEVRTEGPACYDAPVSLQLKQLFMSGSSFLCLVINEASSGNNYHNFFMTVSCEF